MSIWKSPMSIEEINELIKDTMDSSAGIKYIEVADDYVKATMNVDHRTVQPFGIMHGGASCVLAESLGSIAANMCVDKSKSYCVGQSIHTHHIKKGLPGQKLTGTARPIHLGGTSQLWEILIENESGKLVSTTRLLVAVLGR